MFIKWIQISGPKVTHVHHHEFIKKRFKGIGKDSVILSWLVCNTFHVFLYLLSFLCREISFISQVCMHFFFLTFGNCFLLPLVHFLQKTIGELISLHFPFFFSILLVSSFIDHYLNQITLQCVLVLSW